MKEEEPFDINKEIKSMKSTIDFMGLMLFLIAAFLFGILYILISNPYL